MKLLVETFANAVVAEELLVVLHFSLLKSPAMQVATVQVLEVVVTALLLAEVAVLAFQLIALIED